jgi:two-component sensor histidine kinase/PAS domain-containing protein
MMIGKLKQTFNTYARATGLAALVVALALLIRMAASDWLGANIPFITFFPAVLVAAMIGGWAAGVLAILLTLLAGGIYLHIFETNEPPFVAVAFYVAGCGISIIAAETLRNARDRYKMAEHKLVIALGVSGIGTWRWDIARDRVEWDHRLCDIYGRHPDEAPKVAADFLNLVCEDDRAHVMLVIEAPLDQPDAEEYVYRIHHPQKGVRWISDRNNVLCGPDGKPVEIIGSSTDITERKQADEHRDLLIRELHHRVRNTLAMVQGMANATANSAHDLTHFKETFARRIASLAMTHALLTDEKNQTTTLSRLVRQEMEALGMADRLDLTGPDLLLASELAVPIGMALHELATNALKHGALSAAQGRVHLNCTLNEDVGDISWRESGGPVVTPSERRGFGVQVFERVIQVQLGATTSRVFAPDGLCVTISIPRDKLTGSANENGAHFHAHAS